MKIEITMYGKTVSWDNNLSHSSRSLDETPVPQAVEAFMGLMVLSGFNEANVIESMNLISSNQL